jgi:hypothetical protein
LSYYHDAGAAGLLAGEVLCIGFTQIHAVSANRAYLTAPSMRAIDENHPCALARPSRDTPPETARRNCSVVPFIAFAAITGVPGER